MDKQSLESLLDQGLSIERIAKRFGKDPSTISYWMRKHGLESPYREKHASKGRIARERLEALVEAGMTIAEIADAVGRSKGTGRHWMREYRLYTQNSRGRRPQGQWRAAKSAGLLTITMSCFQHGTTEFILEARLLPLQEVSVGARGTTSARRQGDTRRGSRWSVSALWLRPLHRSPAVPSCGSGEQRFQHRSPGRGSGS